MLHIFGDKSAKKVLGRHLLLGQVKRFTFMKLELVKVCDYRLQCLKETALERHVEVPSPKEVLEWSSIQSVVDLLDLSDDVHLL